MANVYNNLNNNNNNNHIYELLHNGTINLLDDKINKMLYGMNNNIIEENFENTVILMALIDKRYYNNETELEYNYRIRLSIANNFNKHFLTDNKKQLFRTWERNIENLSMNASRIELFSYASINALSIIGF